MDGSSVSTQLVYHVARTTQRRRGMIRVKEGRVSNEQQNKQQYLGGVNKAPPHPNKNGTIVPAKDARSKFMTKDVLDTVAAKMSRKARSEDVVWKNEIKIADGKGHAAIPHAVVFSANPHHRQKQLQLQGPSQAKNNCA